MLSVNDSQLPVYAINRWGPSMWDAMLACAYVYPRRPSARDRKNMTAFLTSLSPVLPCGDCRHHFASELDRMPDDVLDSSENLMMWMYDVQCNIAISHHEKAVLSDVEDVLRVRRKKFKYFLEFQFVTVFHETR